MRQADRAARGGACLLQGRVPVKDDHWRTSPSTGADRPSAGRCALPGSARLPCGSGPRWARCSAWRRPRCSERLDLVVGAGDDVVALASEQVGAGISVSHGGPPRSECETHPLRREVLALSSRRAVNNLSGHDHLGPASSPCLVAAANDPSLLFDHGWPWCVNASGTPIRRAATRIPSVICPGVRVPQPNLFSARRAPRSWRCTARCERLWRCSVPVRPAPRRHSSHEPRVRCSRPGRPMTNRRSGSVSHLARRCAWREFCCVARTN